MAVLISARNGLVPVRLVGGGNGPPRAWPLWRRGLRNPRGVSRIGVLCWPFQGDGSTGVGNLGRSFRRGERW